MPYGHDCDEYDQYSSRPELVHRRGARVFGENNFRLKELLMGIKLDFSNVSDGFDPIPGGVYPARVDVVEQGESKEGKPKVTFTFVLTGGEFKGRKLWLVHSLQAQALFALKKTLLGLGEEPGDLSGLAEVNFSEYIGRTCKLAVIQDQYQGELTNKVRSVLRHDAVIPGDSASEGSSAF